MPVAEARNGRSNPVDLVDHHEKLLLFRQYVDECLEESTERNPVCPVSFEEWERAIFRVNLDEKTVVLRFQLQSETAAGGFLTGGNTENIMVRVPANFVAEDVGGVAGGILDLEGMQRVAAKFDRKMHRRLSSVWYRGHRLYNWTQ